MKRLAMVLSTLAMVAAPQAASAQVVEIGHIPQCTEIVPAVVALSNANRNIDVRVLLDGVSVARASQIFGTANQAYAPLGLQLVPSYQTVGFSGPDAQGLIDQAKAAFGGSRPGGIDIVYVLTSKDIASGAGGEAVAGMADCIGGVAFGDRAFAVGEDVAIEPIDILGVSLLRDLGAKTAAHELGHLLGAHHHYANCIEPLVAALVAARGEPCSLMFNDLTFQNLRFGTLNSLIVRGHAQRYT